MSLGDFLTDSGTEPTARLTAPPSSMLPRQPDANPLPCTGFGGGSWADEVEETYGTYLYCFYHVA